MNLLLLRAGYPVAIVRVEDRLQYTKAIMDWRMGNDKPFKQIIRSVVLASLEEMLSFF